MVVAWKIRQQGLGNLKFARCSMTNKILGSGQDLKKVDRFYLDGMNCRKIKPSLQGVKHHALWCLCSSFKNLSSCICPRYIGNTQSLIKNGSSRTKLVWRARKDNGELGCGCDAIPVQLCKEALRDRLNDWAREGSNEILCKGAIEKEDDYCSGNRYFDVLQPMEL